AVSPGGMAVVPSLWNCPSTVGGAGGVGIDVAKSAADSEFPPNGVQGLARPVWSAVRACQWYPVLLASPGTTTNPGCPVATRSPVCVGDRVLAVRTGASVSAGT